MADHAAEAAALALVNRKPVAQAAADAVPGWPRSALRVRQDRDTVAVTLLPPSPFRILSGRLAIRAEAAAGALEEGRELVSLLAAAPLAGPRLPARAGGRRSRRPARCGADPVPRRRRRRAQSAMRGLDRRCRPRACAVVVGRLRCARRRARAGELVGHCPDLTVLVVPGDVEPALVSLVIGIVAARLGRIVVVANRVRDRERWSGRAALWSPIAHRRRPRRARTDLARAARSRLRTSCRDRRRGRGFRPRAELRNLRRKKIAICGISRLTTVASR